MVKQEFIVARVSLCVLRDRSFDDMRSGGV